MSLQAVQCEDCGGSVAFAEDKSFPECPFCGSTKQIPKPIDRQVRPPSSWVPFSIDEEQADIAFRTFAQSSFWYPKDIRNASLELKALLLPAWRWSGTVESHYNGLRSASSKSGFSPASGRDSVHFSQIWVPASQALTLSEVNEIAPFPSETAQSLEQEPALPFEVGELTERIALRSAKAAMSNAHHNHIHSKTGLRKLKTSSIHHNLSGEPGLIPIYIGVYRRKDKYYRILVNGATGKLIGDAPLDWVKIVGIIATILAVILIVVNL